MQYLKLPIDNFKPTAGYKNEKYAVEWHYTHFGTDCVSASKNRALYGLGNGKVIAAGLDGLNGKTTGDGSGCGYCLIIVYDDVFNHYSGNHYDVTCTYMHMAEMPKVKKGDKVTADTLLGYYGNTGAKTSGSHLHIQFDRDTKYPLLCCGISKAGHNLLKKGKVDSTVDPTHILHIADGQKVTAPASSWYNQSDFVKLPKIPTSSKSSANAVKTSNGKRVIVIGANR